MNVVRAFILNIIKEVIKTSCASNCFFSSVLQKLGFLGSVYSWNYVLL